MFVQVIQGTLTDQAQIRAALDRWVGELAPDASGWLGTTAGVTEDGRFIALARFENEELDQWWAETAKLFTGEATFRDSTDVTVDLQGNPDDAGFVQIIQGRSSDPERVKELTSQDSDQWAEYRPDIIGSLAIGHEGGAYTVAIYFTSEAEAREGERKEPPPEIAAQMAEMQKLEVGEPEFFDIKDPWLYSPR
jgi:hypothetical protein